MLPSFGCNVKGFLFEPYDEITARSIAIEIKEAFEQHEPRIIIQKVNVTLNTGFNYSSMYDVEVIYEVKQNRQRDTLSISLEKL
jgi:phage baseplate assembly protein W